MFKKIVVAVLLAGVISLSGCSLLGSSDGSTPTPTLTPIVTVPTSTSNTVIPVDSIYDVGYPVNAPSDQTWLSPGKLEIKNYVAGATVRCVLRVHNGNSVDTPFSILYSIPDNTDNGFVSSTSQSRYWISVSDSNPIIPAMTTREIVVTLNMPTGSVEPGINWEFWVCCKDISQSTIVQTQLCTKFKVTMGK